MDFYKSARYGSIEAADYEYFLSNSNGLVLIEVCRMIFKYIPDNTNCVIMGDVHPILALAMRVVEEDRARTLESLFRQAVVYAPIQNFSINNPREKESTPDLFPDTLASWNQRSELILSSAPMSHSLQSTIVTSLPKEIFESYFVANINPPGPTSFHTMNVLFLANTEAGIPKDCLLSLGAPDCNKNFPNAVTGYIREDPNSHLFHKLRREGAIAKGTSDGEKKFTQEEELAYKQERVVGDLKLIAIKNLLQHYVSIYNDKSSKGEYAKKIWSKYCDQDCGKWKSMS